MQRSADFKNIAIVHVKKSTYKIYFSYMNKHKAKKLIKKFDPINKTGSINCNDYDNNDNKNEKWKWQWKWEWEWQ